MKKEIFLDKAIPLSTFLHASDLSPPLLLFHTGATWKCGTDLQDIHVAIFHDSMHT